MASDLEFFNYQKLTDDLADETHPVGQCNDGCARCDVYYFPFDLGIEALNDTGSGVHVHCTKGVVFVADAYVGREYDSEG
jgi:hypothetical protein